MDLILASGSVYRRAQIEELGYQFSWEKPPVDEDETKALRLPALNTALELARLKAEAIASKNPEAAVIGADQVAVFDQERLDKPGTHELAKITLQKLNGNKHKLVTAVSLYLPSGRREHINVTELKMRKLTDSQIEEYLQQDKPYDCAGSYKFEENGASLFESVSTSDTSAITGLPTQWLKFQLSKLDIEES